MDNAEGLETSQTARAADGKYIGPMDLGYFSIEGEMFKPDKSQMKYYSNPENLIGSDLNEGFSEEFRRRDFRRTRMEDLGGILYWILNEPSKTYDVEFVMRRGTLVKLCQTTFNKREETVVWVNLFQGKYFIAVDSPIETWQDQKKRNYRGFKFEQISTTAQPGGVPDENAPVCDSGTYYRVLQGTVSSEDESHSILFSAKTDCCSRNDNNQCEPVELKTYIQGKREEPTWFTYYYWWLQSYVAGISKIVCGFLTTEGVLQSVEELNVQGIYYKVANDRYYPDCTPFKGLAKFVKEVKLMVTEDQPSALFTLKGQTCEHRLMDEDFLPDWFKDGLSRQIRASPGASHHSIMKSSEQSS